MTNIKKYLCVGIGGMGCRCCFPSRGDKARRYLFRAAKRKQKIEAFKIEQENSGND